MTDLAKDLRHERKACDPFALCIALGLVAGPGTFTRQTGGGVMVRCPSHEEHTPSCSVRVAKDGTVAVKCHACGYSADAIGLVEKVRGLDFKEALAELARITNRLDVADALERRGTGPAPARPRPTPRPAPAASPAVDPELLDRVYSALLDACPLRSQADVTAYVRGRAIYADAEAIGCGALPAPGAPQAALVEDLARTFGAKALGDVGLVAGDALRAPSHRLVIPWRSADGKIASLQRRAIQGSPARKYEWPRGVPTPPDLFGADMLDEARAFMGDDPPIVVTEGAIDCLSRRKIARLDGERVLVVAVPSASTVRAEWAGVFAGRDVLVATDPDEAGERCARALVEKCLRGARSTQRERCTVGDWNQGLRHLLTGEVGT